MDVLGSFTRELSSPRTLVGRTLYAAVSRLPPQKNLGQSEPKKPLSKVHTLSVGV